MPQSLRTAALAVQSPIVLTTVRPPMFQTASLRRARFIKRLQAVLLGVFLSAPAWAGWEEIERFDDGLRIYVDRHALRRDGEVGYAAHLVRWSEPQTGDDHPPYRSTVVRSAYHCEQKLERYLGSVSYAGAFGDGAKVLEDSDEAVLWYRVSDDSMEGKLWRLVCGAVTPEPAK